MQPSQPNRYIAFGKHFGFPECCVKAFTADFCATTKRLYPEGPWMGSGFIPCACCAKDALDFDKFVAERITPNRVCASPFPNDDSDDQGAAMVELFDKLNARKDIPFITVVNHLSDWTRKHVPGLHSQLSRIIAHS